MAIDNLIAKKEQYLSEIENYKKREEDQMGNSYDKEEANVKDELIFPENYKQTYDKIVKMIETAKYKVFVTKALHGEVFPIG